MKKDHPGVYVPPPLIYVAFFLGSIALQNRLPFEVRYIKSFEPGIGWLFVTFGLVFILPALQRFLASKNTLITIKAASSLETTGIYAYSRNPMYLGLLLVYCGIAFLKGNLWALIVVPMLTIVVQLYVIRKEEYYLQRTFGEEYEAYRKRVRRWI